MGRMKMFWMNCYPLCAMNFGKDVASKDELESVSKFNLWMKNKLKLIDIVLEENFGANIVRKKKEKILNCKLQFFVEVKY